MTAVIPLMFLIFLAAPRYSVTLTAYLLDDRRGIVPAIFLGIVAPFVAYIVLVALAKSGLLPRAEIKDLLGIGGALFIASAIVALAPTVTYVLGYKAYKRYRARRKSMMELVLLAITTSYLCMVMFYTICFGEPLLLATAVAVGSIVLGIAITLDLAIGE